MLTKRELLELWRRYDFRPNKRLGQNFLIDNNVKNKIIEFIDPQKDDVILEIGAGFGELTLDLLKLCKKVIAFEKDKRVSGIFKKIIGHANNIELIEEDFLESSLHRGFNKIAGNLPYYISTPIIEKLLDFDNKTDISGIFVMVQIEYARRILAGPGHKDYSSLTLFIEQHMKAQKLMKVKRTCFFPAPDVDSMFLKLKYLDTPKFVVKDRKLLNKVIRTSFQQRRKKLINALTDNILEDKGTLKGMLEELGINENSRPEELSLEQFSKLTDKIWEQKR